jgi:hypothetical protein
MHQRLILALALTAAVGSTADAQLANGKWQAPAGGAAATTPRKGVQVQETPKQTQTNSNSAVPLRVIQAVVMSDGRILADFGYGLEQVTRSCPSSASTMPLQVIGTSQVPDPTRQPMPDPTRQPIPGLTPQQRAASKESAQASCHVRDSRGVVFATR